MDNYRLAKHTDGVEVNRRGTWYVVSEIELYNAICDLQKEIKRLEAEKKRNDGRKS